MRRPRPASSALALLIFVAATEPAAGQSLAADAQAGLRTFTLEKPAPSPAASPTATPSPSPGLTPPGDHVSGLVGVGYVEGADWATDLRLSGTFAGLAVGLRSLVTTGASHTLLDQGLLTIASPNASWSLEAGDLFSPLAGIGRGLRTSWSMRGDRQPSVLISFPRPELGYRPALVTVRDRLRVRKGTVVDAEVANDGSYLLATRAEFGRVALDASDRRRREPWSHDRAFGATVNVWRGIRVRGASARSNAVDGPGRWHTAAISWPLGKIDLTIERTISTLGPVRNVMSSIVGNTTVGGLMLFHRQQWGTIDYRSDDLILLQSLQHQQSMATYGFGPRMRLTLQMASQWLPSGRVSTWEELLTSWQPTSKTKFDVAVAVPRFTTREQLRARLTQDLPGRFVLELDYGRVAPYQITTLVDSRPRARATLLYRLNIVTPPGRAVVQGTVLDHAARPVSGAIVRLGPYAVGTDAAGQFGFRNVPRGEFDLSLDEGGLSADQTWDGHRERVNTAREARRDVVLRVAPLGTITGRVFADKNGNHRFDDGEEMNGVVVALNPDHATVSDAHGVYGFYNLPPGSYVVELATKSLGADFSVQQPMRHAVLDAGRPVVGLDFEAVRRPVPIRWSAIP